MSAGSTLEAAYKNDCGEIPNLERCDSENCKHYNCERLVVSCETHACRGKPCDDASWYKNENGVTLAEGEPKK